MPETQIILVEENLQSNMDNKELDQRTWQTLSPVFQCLTFSKNRCQSKGHYTTT